MKIKFTHLLLSFFLLVAGVPNAIAQSPTDLFISEYVEGSSNNKAIELYNGTGSPIDLAAGNYVIQMYFNGSTTATTIISLTGTVAPNGVFVLAHGSATFASSPFVNQTNSSSWYNGDDAVVLRKGGTGGTILDAIGQVGFDPGAEWGTGLVSTSDNTLRRKSSHCSGDANASDAFDPSIEWDGFAQDVFSDLGSHTSSCVAGPSVSVTPSSLNLTTTPGVPSAEQSYIVSGNALTEDITITIPILSNFGLSTVPGGPYTSSVTIAAASANAGPVTIYIIYSPPAAGTQSGNITHVSGAYSANLAVLGSASSGTGTPVFIIQGSGAASSLDGSIVTTEGLVTADFQAAGQLGGFFIQDTAGDGNSATSDGIFVFNNTFAVNVGDYIRLTAEVDEFFNKTELKNITGLTVLSSGNPLMAPVTINLPVNSISDLESYEGMLVKFPQTLTVTETFTLARYGEVALSADGRVFNPTNFVDPNDNPASGTTSSGTSNVAAVTAQQSLNDRRRILLDDGSTVENPAVVPYLNPADTTLRCGSTIADLTGVLDYDFSVYRLQPTQAPAFSYAARPAVPSVGAANVKVAGFNVLNYFNGNGSGGGFPTERGAHTLAEFNRQRVKIIAAIKSLDAGVVGLTEIENDGDNASSAIADLVNGLNAATAPGTYAYIADPAGSNGNTGTDAIKVAMIYKPGIVTPSGPSKADVNAVHNRPPLAQTFTVNGSGEKFTAIISHFKSKSCSSASGSNIDLGDGQGCYNGSRKLQAAAFLAFVAALQASSGDPDIIALGDYNAYEQEDPMDILLAGGLVNILPDTYSYVFEGQSGSLDHALATNSLIAQISGAAKWHINADEPISKDYNQEFNPSYLYSPGPYRSSDHDPVLVGFNMQAATIPVVANISKSVNEDNHLLVTKADFKNAFSDVDGDSLSKIKIIQLPVNGVLKLNTVSVTVNQEINVNAFNELVYTPVANFNGADSIGWNGSDNSSYADAPAKVLITVIPVNDIPVVTITDPADNTSYPAGSTITMKVNASSADGSITKVEFYNAGVKLGEDVSSPYEITGQGIEPGDFVLTAKAFNSNGDSAVSDTVRISVIACAGSGAISAEGFTDISGTGLISLANSIKYPNSPDVVTELNKFEYGPDFADNYGARVRGYICAPQTGNYIFYISSDDQSELWLSTDESPVNIRRIAYVSTRVNFRSWFTTAEQRSVAIRLIKGAKYYIESVHKEGTGSDHLSVSWLLPNGVFEGPIAGSRLSPMSAPAPLIAGVSSRPSFGEALRNATTSEAGEIVTGLQIAASPNPSQSYFTLRTKSNKDELLVITITDALGRVVEKRTQVAANGTVQMGRTLLPGIYFAEVMQGEKKQRVKLVKQ